MLTNKNYFEDTSYMSVSQYKDFMSCEARAMAKLQKKYEQPKTKALMIGSYVDAYFEGTLETFKTENPQIFKKNGELYADYKKADSLIARAESDKLFMEYLSGEKQVIKTGKLFGIDWKIKIDSLLPDKIVDLKVMRQIEPIMGVPFVEHWGYDIQLAVYQAIEGNNLDTYISVITKEEVPNLEILHIPQYRLNESLENVEKNINHVVSVKNGVIEPKRCGVCEFCKQTKVLTKPIDYTMAGFTNQQIKDMEEII